MKTFKSCEIQEIEAIFGLKKFNSLDNYFLLTNWLNVDKNVKPEPQIVLENLRKNLLKKVDYWNETELQMGLISPILVSIASQSISKARQSKAMTSAVPFERI